MKVKVKTRVVNSFHLETEDEREITVDNANDKVVLWIGNPGEYYDTTSVDWASLDLSKDELEVLIEALQVKLEEMK